MGTGIVALLERLPLSRLRRLAKRLLAEAGIRLVGRQQVVGRVGGESARYSFQIPGLVGSYLLTRGTVSIGGWVIDTRTGATPGVRARLRGETILAERLERADLRAALSDIVSLPLDCGFGLDLTAQPGAGILTLEAELSPARWEPVFRCVVLCWDRDLPRFVDGDIWRYRDWARREDAASAESESEQRDGAGLLAGRPSVSIVVLSGEGDLGATDASIRAQTYPAHETILVDPAAGIATLGAALRAARGDYVLPLLAGDRLRPEALHVLAGYLAADPSLDLVYADEDADGEGRDPIPYFKPGWSPDTLEAFDYLGAPALYRTSEARPTDAEGLYDLALRFTETRRAIRHVPRVLCRRAAAPTAPADPRDDAMALCGRLSRTGRSGRVAPIAPGLRCFCVDVVPAAEPPLVSVVVPTAGRDLMLGGRPRDLILDCVTGILNRSSYARIEIVVVADADLAGEKRAALERLGCRIVDYAEPALNIAAKINLGAAQARGEMLLLLNDDTEIVTQDWIERLLAHALKAHVGAVGAKLLYLDGTLQHAGVVTLRGNPNHVRLGYPGRDCGYVFSTAAPRNYAAVTGACMMTPAACFRAVGGYCEDMPVHFNDVDYCFALRRLGFHVVMEPRAVLTHFESASRSRGVVPAELALFQDKWAEDLVDDPFYPNLAFATVPPSFEVFLRAETHTA